MTSLEPQNGFGYAGSKFQVFREVCPRAENRPGAGEEEEERRSNELLKRPTPSELNTVCIESGILSVEATIIDVSQVAITYARERIVAEHGDDGLRELCTARLVDTAGVNPDPTMPVACGEFTTPPDLLANEVAGVRAVFRAFLLNLPYFLERLLLLIPDM